MDEQKFVVTSRRLVFGAIAWLIISIASTAYLSGQASALGRVAVENQKTIIVRLDELRVNSVDQETRDSENFRRLDALDARLAELENMIVDNTQRIERLENVIATKAR